MNTDQFSYTKIKASALMEEKRKTTLLKRKKCELINKIPYIGPHLIQTKLKSTNSRDRISLIELFKPKKNYYARLYKNASSTILNSIIISNFGENALTEWIDDYEVFQTDISDAVNYFPHKTLSIPQNSSELPFDSFIFTFVRNPWDRLLSLYRNKIKKPYANHINLEYDVFWLLKTLFNLKEIKSFQHFIELVAECPDEISDPHFKSQYYTLQNNIAGRPGEILPNFIGRFEFLERDMETLKLRHEINLSSKVRLQSSNSNKKHDYRDEYSSRMIKLVEQRYKQDIDYFKYSF
jgi:hypothetical protein